MKEIKLGRSGLVTLVDDEDFVHFGGGWWSTHKSHRMMYARKHWRDENRKQCSALLHNLVMGGIGVDHINHDGLDNRRQNLRFVTNSENQCNSRARRNSSSRFKGVHWYAKSSKWQVAVGGWGSGTRKHVGYFRDEVEAALAYDEAALRMYGEHASLNFQAVLAVHEQMVSVVEHQEQE